MAFHVIHPAPGLDDHDREQALLAGPPFVDSGRPYPDLVAEAGFSDIVEMDLTAEWRDIEEGWLTESAKVIPELEEVFGGEAVAESREERHNTIAAIDAGLLKRSLYFAIVS